MSRQMFRLPAFNWVKYTDCPLTSGATMRVVSPEGRSSLTTSAPRSVNIRPTMGPATTSDRSSTRTPTRGRGFMLIAGCYGGPNVVGGFVGCFFKTPRHLHQSGGKKMYPPPPPPPAHLSPAGCEGVG